MSYEQIVLTFRTLADRNRICILLLLAHHAELSASEIAEKLHLSRPNASFHLKMLCASGLVFRRRCGTWIFHSLRSAEQAGWLSSLAAAIREGVRNSGVKQLREYRDFGQQNAQRLVESLFRVATAFTSLRRLLLINHLRDSPAKALQDLLNAVPMSDQALSRHLTKLTNRGYLRSDSRSKEEKLRIPATFESRIQARVLSVVFQALRSGSSSDSAGPRSVDEEQTKTMARG